MDHKEIAMALVESYLVRAPDVGTDPEKVAQKIAELVSQIGSYISGFPASDAAASLAMSIIELEDLKFSDFSIKAVYCCMQRPITTRSRNGNIVFYHSLNRFP